MHDEPDLFSIADEAATCGQCASFLRELSRRDAHYCAVSYRDARADDAACRFYEERRQ